MLNFALEYNSYGIGSTEVRSLNRRKKHSIIQHSSAPYDYGQRKEQNNIQYFKIMLQLIEFSRTGRVHLNFTVFLVKKSLLLFSKCVTSV